MFQSTSTSSRRTFDTIIKKPVFRVVEAYKALRTNILFSIPAEENRAKRILFTSANPGDGKTTVSVNTAITFAQAEMKVVIVDADLRKPTTHKYFGISSKTGLSNILSGQCSVEEALQAVPGVENLYIIPSGILPPNPSELLSGKYADKLFEKLDEIFDVVIVDTPPVTVVSDALAVSNKVDGVLLVASNNTTTYPEIQEAVKNLQFADAKILGIVYNRAKIKIASRNKKYSNYYSTKEV